MMSDEQFLIIINEWKMYARSLENTIERLNKDNKLLMEHAKEMRECLVGIRYDLADE